MIRGGTERFKLILSFQFVLELVFETWWRFGINIKEKGRVREFSIRRYVHKTRENENKLQEERILRKLFSRDSSSSSSFLSRSNDLSTKSESRDKARVSSDQNEKHWPGCNQCRFVYAGSDLERKEDGPLDETQSTEVFNDRRSWSAKYGTVGEDRADWVTSKGRALPG